MLVSPRYDGPPIISITGAPDDQLEPLSRQRKRFGAMLVDLRLEDWDSASRCAGWTVQDVVAHMVGVNNFWLASVRGGLAGAPTRFLTAFDPVETPALMVAEMRELRPDEVLDQLTQSNDALLDVLTEIDDDGWALLAEAPPGHLPIRLIAHHALWDCWVHERDIALPLGLTPATESDEIRSCLSYVSALSPALALVSGTSVGGEFALRAHDPTFSCVLDVSDTVAVRNDATAASAPCLHGDAVTLVEALSIRAPMPESAPAEWLQLVTGLGAAFGAVEDPDVPGVRQGL